MPIKRVHYQGGRDLLNFYNQESTQESGVHPLKAKNMIKVLELLEQLFKDFTVYAVTSHFSLILSANDDHESKVRIGNIGAENLNTVAFELPKEKAPWKGAWVEDILLYTIENLENHILIAMKESEAWNDSEKFNELYKRIK